MAKLVFLVVILAVLLIFTLQNTDPIELSFWPWKLKLSKALLTLASFLSGLVVGFFLCLLRKK